MKLSKVQNNHVVEFKLNYDAFTKRVESFHTIIETRSN